MTSKTITLNNGAKISWLGFGTGTALYHKDAEQAVRMAIDNGITHLDGAQLYNNEESLGAGIKASGKPRSELYIVTKLNYSLPAGQTVRQSLEESIKKLGVDHVDMFLIHHPGQVRKWTKLPELWKEMENLQHAGLTKGIGVSNFNVDDLKEIMDVATIVPAMNQIELHSYVWDEAEPIVRRNKELGIVTSSYAGLTPINRAPGGPVDSIVARIRERLEKAYGKPVSAGQVFTKWLIQMGAIVVTTTTKASRIKEFIDAENLPDITVEEIKELEEAGKKLHKKIF